MIKIKKILNIIIYFIFTIIIIFSIFYLIFLIFLITPNSVSRFYHNHLSYNYDTEHHCVDEGGSFMECYIQRKALFLNFIDDGPEYSSDIIQFTPAHSIVDIEIEESANQSGLRSTSFILNSVNKPIVDCNLCK